MRVRCPRCDTVYRQPASAVRARELSFRCARCGHVFDASPEEPDVGDEAPPDTPGEPEEADAFTLDPDAAVDEDDDIQDELAEDEENRGTPAGTPARFALRALLAVTLAYAALSVYLLTRPELTLHALARVPIVGPLLAERRVSPASIRLVEVRGEYQRIKSDRLVFLISGVAVNTSTVPVRSVQVEGWIAGDEVRRQAVYCGAVPRRIGELTEREITLLQELEPPKEWGLGPGDETTFTIVMLRPPDAPREFGVQVLTVRAPSRERAT